MADGGGKRGRVPRGSEVVPVRVYLCDDVPDIRRLTRRAFEEDPGKEQPPLEVVGEAGDARTAIAEVAALQPDVVLLDLAMPGMHGLEALPRIKEEAPATSVVVFSGSSRAQMAAAALAHGADAYISKGAPLRTLRDAVRQASGVSTK